MTFNLSEVDFNQYFLSTVAVSMSLFALLVLTPGLLCILCAVALFFAKKMNNYIRFLLINIFAAEICKWFSYSIFYLAWPLRLLYQEKISCKISFSLFVVVLMQTFMAGASYAINVYIFVKHGKKKLKWYVVVPFAVVSWTLTVLVAALPYIDELGVFTVNGFCTVDANTIAYKVFVGAIGALALSFITVQLICSMLTCIFVKRNTLEENTDVKKAITKVLAYFAVTSILSFFNNIVPAFNPLIKAAIANENIATNVALYFLLHLAFNIPSIATPIITIMLLKPIRVAIKAMICCCKKRDYSVDT